MANLKSESQNIDFEDKQPKNTNRGPHYKGPQTDFSKLFNGGFCTYARKKGQSRGLAKAYLEQRFGLSVRKIDRLRKNETLEECELLIKIVKEFITMPEPDPLEEETDVSSTKKRPEKTDDPSFTKLDRDWVRKLFQATNTCKQEADRAIKEIFSGEKFLWSNPKIQGVDLTKTHVKREAQLAEWRERLCTNKKNPKPLIMRGMGGTGKTTLVKTLLLDSGVRTHFRHGFLWAELGPYEQGKLNEKVLTYLQNWCNILRIKLDKEEEKNLDRLASKLAMEIKSRKLHLLLIIDDVWGWSDVTEKLLLDGVPAILTTREKDLPQKLNLGPKQLVELGQMNPEEALSLIRNKFENLEVKWDEKWEVNACQLASSVGYLPLALDLGVGIAVWDGWDYLLQGLQKPGGTVTTIRKPDSDGRQDSLEAMLNLSYNRLSPEAQHLLVHLSVFVPNKVFTKDGPDLIYTLRSLQILFGDNESIWKQAFKRLADKSLLLSEKSENEEYYYLHKAVVDYADLQKEKEKDAIDIDIHFILKQWHRLVSMTYDPPRKQARLMKEEWPDVVRAWRKIVDLGSHLRSRITDLSQLTYEFSEMGCNILGRLQQWDEIILWTQEAQQVIEEDTDQKGNRPYLEGLTMWQVDALLQKRQMGEAATLINKRREDSWVNSRQWWGLRYEIRYVRCLLNQEDLGEIESTITELRNELIRIKTIRDATSPESFEKEKLRYITHYNSIQVALNFSPPFLIRENIEESWILEAEIRWLLGDYENRRGQNPQKIEAHWQNAVMRVSGSGFRCLTPCFVTDWWWFEGITAQVVGLLAACKEWDRAILVAQRWIELRRILDLPIGNALIKITGWIISNGEQKFIDWASTQLKLLTNSNNEQKPAIKHVDALQEGLRLATQGEREEAARQVKAIVATYANSVPKFPCNRYPTIRIPDEGIDDGDYEGRFDKWLPQILANNDLIAADEDGDSFRNRILHLTEPFDASIHFSKKPVFEWIYFRPYLI